MADKNESASDEMDKGASGYDVEKTDSTGPTPSNSSGNSDDLEDLFVTFKKQVSNSDWLKKNTAEKWVQENPELAKEYMEAAKKS